MTRSIIRRYGNYYSDMVADGDGKLDASGRLEIPFDVPANDETTFGTFNTGLKHRLPMLHAAASTAPPIWWPHAAA